MRGVASLALVLLMAGCSTPPAQEPLPEEWRGRDLRQPGWVNETLQPGWTLALEYDWSSGTRVAWDWIVFEPIFVHFQILRDDPDGVEALVAHDAQEGKGERTIVPGGRHEIDWMNEFPRPVTIAHHVPAGYAKVLYPPGQGPGCIFAPGAAAVADACLMSPLP